MIRTRRIYDEWTAESDPAHQKYIGLILRLSCGAAIPPKQRKWPKCSQSGADLRKSEQMGVTRTYRPSSTSGVPVDTGPLGELAVTRGAEKITTIYTEGVRPRASVEAPGLTRAILRCLEGKDPVAAALASIVSWMPPSETSPSRGIEVANAKVKAWRKAEGKERGRMRLWERCSELLRARRRSRYLTAKWTGRHRPNHQSGNPTGCLKNLRLRRNRRNMNA